MAEKPEDLNIPAAVIGRLIKEALPSGVVVSKEARSAIGKSASVFILFVTAAANGFVEQANRRTLTAADVLNGLEDMELHGYVDPLKEVLAEHKRLTADKKKRKSGASIAGAGGDVIVEDEQDEMIVVGGVEEDGDSDIVMLD